jgi:Alpha/beta hydrolase domain
VKRRSDDARGDGRDDVKHRAFCCQDRMTDINRIAFAPFHRQELIAGGAAFGACGAYERIEGVVAGALDPVHPANRGIALLDQAPCNADGLVEYQASYILMRPADPVLGNGRLLYEVNNRGRIMMLANLCAGAAGNDPQAVSDLGNALPLRLGYALLWTGWDCAAPKSTGLWFDVPRIEGMTRIIREEFVSGTRLGVHGAFRLAHDAVRVLEVTVRRSQTVARVPVAFVRTDSRTVRLLPDGPKPAIGSIYEIHYEATNPPVQGIGFAATRDIVSHIRHHGRAFIGRPITHALAFGISQAGRYLRDHIAQGFNADQDRRRVFDGVLTHVAGIGRVFLNTPFAQPFRTRTWHQDHDFPEVEFPFSSAVMTDPLTGTAGALMRGDACDPKLIETNTSTEYWQKGASLLHTDPLGTRDVALPPNVRGYLIAGTQHGGKANMPRDNGPCVNPRNWHDPMPAVRTLLVALDEWVVTDREPPPSCLPSIADKSLVAAEDVALPAVPGLRRPAGANDVYPLNDWVDPRPPARAWRALVPQVDADGNEIAGIRLPDIAVPRGTFTGWNLYRAPYPEGELADREGTFIAFADSEAPSGDPRPPIAERYGSETGYAERLKRAVDELRSTRFLLAEDAEHFLARGKPD